MADLNYINLLVSSDETQLNRSSTLCQLSYNGYVYNLGVRYAQGEGTKYYLNAGTTMQSINMNYNGEPKFTSKYSAGETCDKIYFVKNYEDDTAFQYDVTIIGNEKLEYYNANEAIAEALSTLTGTSVDNIADVVIERLNTWGVPIISGDNRVFFDTGAKLDDKSPLGQSLTNILMHVPGHMVIGERGIKIPNPEPNTTLEEPDTTTEEQ